jgi:MoaA/NifB/PqqE/SkfB family radical SAM enzyme/predicted SAM-dependent methyltransferase
MEQGRTGSALETSFITSGSPRNATPGTVNTPTEASQLLPECLPRTFTIETALACNLRCPECAIGGDMISRPKSLLRFERFKQIADKIRPYAEYLYLHLWGEPLLNKDIFRMIAYAAEFTRTNISTNGLLLTEESAERLITSGVSDVIVSIDGVAQDVYEKYRVGGDAQRAREGLLYLQKANLRHGGRVHIAPQFIVFMHNQHEMNDFTELCSSLRLTPSFKAPYIRVNDSHFRQPDDPRYQRPFYTDIDALRAAMADCVNPREVFTILSDGSVVICCHDYDRQTNFGNIFTRDVLEIWKSPAYTSFREAVLSGHAPDFCINHCMTWQYKKPLILPSPTRVDDALPDKRHFDPGTVPAGLKVNLCSGVQRLPGYLNVDLEGGDVNVDLEKSLLPLDDHSVDTLVCMSAINYFTFERARELTADMYRVLRPGGIVRVGVQDLTLLTYMYLARDEKFWFQKGADGNDRFPGKTFGEKLNGFFFGFPTAGDKRCKFVYDAETLTALLHDAGFEKVTQKGYRESDISGIEDIDNRPDQMFFLEAVKETPAVSSAKENVQERAWQTLLIALEKSPGDRVLVGECAGVLEAHHRFADLVILCDRFLAQHPENKEIQLLRERAAQSAAQQAVENDDVQKRRRSLELLDYAAGAVRSDAEHLNAAVHWITRAQDAHPGGGVAALYALDRQTWDVDYPETTGYIIPTLLAFAELRHDDAARARAVRMGEWELALQQPDGGVGEPPGVFGLRPRVFNTSQVMLGWLALAEQTGEEKYRVALRKAADWIVSSQDPDGGWRRNTYRGARAYKSRVSWALLAAGQMLHEERYTQSALRGLEWTLKQALPNGWFDQNSLSDPEKPWTHLIGYVLQGLTATLPYLGPGGLHDRIVVLLISAAESLAADLSLRKRTPGAGRIDTVPATYDRRWQSRDSWSCLTGTAQLAYFLKTCPVKSTVTQEAAGLIIRDVKSRQLLESADVNATGGIPGSYPIGAPYCSFAIPNWGVKFFADCLLKNVLPPDRLRFLG